MSIVIKNVVSLNLLVKKSPLKKSSYISCLGLVVPFCFEWQKKLLKTVLKPNFLLKCYTLILKNVVGL